MKNIALFVLTTCAVLAFWGVAAFQNGYFVWGFMLLAGCCWSAVNDDMTAVKYTIASGVPLLAWTLNVDLGIPPVVSVMMALVMSVMFTLPAGLIMSMILSPEIVEEEVSL